MYNLLIEPLVPWKFWIDLGSAGCAFAAAAFWLKVLVVEMPGGIHLVHPHFELAVLEATGRQSRLNSIAARSAAVAAILTGISVFDRHQVGLSRDRR